MPCFHPVTAWKAKIPNDNGKFPIRFMSNGTPSIQVPCGKCHGCFADRSMYWSIRAYHESTLYHQNSFLTLTFDDANVTRDLLKKPLQDFFKRLRHKYKFRYLACGERGEQTGRPHYHAIIFGQDFLSGAINISDKLYTNPVVQDAWGLGHISLAEVNMSSICYVAGYVHKKISDSSTFSLQSSNPGIGHNWIDKYADDILRTGTISIEGKEYPAPKRYLQWHEDYLAPVIEERQQFAANMSFEEKSRRDAQHRARERHKLSELKNRSFKL